MHTKLIFLKFCRYSS